MDMQDVILTTTSHQKLLTWFSDFIKHYIPSNVASSTEDFPNNSTVSKYVQQIIGLKDLNSHTLYIDAADMFAYNPVYAQSLIDIYSDILSDLEEVISSIAEPVVDKSFLYDPNSLDKKLKFSIAIFNLSPALVITPKDVECKILSKLTCLSGTVTRMSDISHQLQEATYICKYCKTSIKLPLQSYVISHPTKCKNDVCKASKPNDFYIDFYKSHFVDFQRLKIQENSSDIEPGRMPQTIEVIVRGEIVDTCKPGDRVLITGYVSAIPTITYNDIPNATASEDYDSNPTNDITALTIDKKILTYKLMYIASHIAQSSTFIRDDAGEVLLALRNNTEHSLSKGSTDIRLDPIKQKIDFLVDQFYMFMSRYNDEGVEYQEALENTLPQMLQMSNNEPDEFMETLSQDQQETIVRMVERAEKDTESFLHDLTTSFASHIEGLEHIKLAILLLLVGGVSKHTEKEGMALRGDINICLVGDPSVAKSQFLKFVSQLDPRTVYTSGKSSSAAGLTAAVVKDLESGDFTVEAGALILADQSVCCLDEFEKLDEADRVAIHEAMEQQSISISKAGIQCTLNARTSVLAAMNPVYGRYRKDKTLRENVTLPPSLLSRFDLIFVITDDTDPDLDRRIAQKILAFHRESDSSPIVSAFDNSHLSLYLEFCSRNQPVLSDDVCELLARKFVQMRQRDSNSPNSSFTMTVRQLESMIRLCEAHAKLRASFSVTPDDVRAVINIIEKASIQTETGDVVFEDDVDFEDGTNDIQTDDFVGQGEEDASYRQIPKSVMALTRMEYRTWSQEIISMVTDKNGISAGEIVRNMLELHTDKVNLDDYESFVKLVTRVLSRMVAVDNVLIISNSDVDNELDITFDIHPGFLH